jgi:hypothetical protein
MVWWYQVSWLLEMIISLLLIEGLERIIIIKIELEMKNHVYLHQLELVHLVSHTSTNYV